MKKTLVVLLALLIPTTLMATPLMQIGGTVFYANTVASDEFTDGLGDFSNYGFGVEARLNLFDYVSIAVPATIGFGDVMTFGTQPSLSVNIPIIEWFDLAFGVGTKLDFANHDDSWLVNGRPIDDFGDAFGNAAMTYRLSAMVTIGTLSTGITATIPTKGTFNDFNAVPEWEAAIISASVLFNFF